MDGGDHGRVAAVLRAQPLPGQGGTPPGTEGADIGMGLAADGVEADVVQIVGAGDDDEKGVFISVNPGEAFVKGGQDDFVGAGGPGVFREFRPVLQHGDAETEHAADFCHRNADMAPAADDELRIVHGQILQIQHDSILTFAISFFQVFPGSALWNSSVRSL